MTQPSAEFGLWSLMLCKIMYLGFPYIPGRNLVQIMSAAQPAAAAIKATTGVLNPAAPLSPPFPPELPWVGDVVGPVVCGVVACGAVVLELVTVLLLVVGVVNVGSLVTTTTLPVATAALPPVLSASSVRISPALA